MPRIARMRANIGLLVFVVVVSYIMLDRAVLFVGLAGGASLTARVVDEVRINLFPSPYWGPCTGNLTHLSPGCTQIYHGHGTWLPATMVVINEQGFRGPSRSVNKSGQYRIFILGDSYTFGAGVEADEAYPAVLERMLNKHLEAIEFEVFNLGMPGGSTDTEYQVLLHYMDYQPDLVILQTLGNDMVDCDLFREQAQQEGVGRDAPDAAGKQQAFLDYAGNLPLEERCSCVWHYLDKFQEILKEVPLLIYDGMEEFGCFRREGVSFDVKSAESLGQRKYTLSRRDPHPNREGHRRMAEELLPAVLEISRGETCAADALGMEVVPCH